MEEVHIPGQTDAEFDAPEPTNDAPPAPAPDAPPSDTPPAEPKPGDEPAPEPKPDEPKPDDTPEPLLPKKRSIYDDLKETRQEKNAFKDAAIAALEAQGVKLTGKETAEELQALAKQTPAPKPEAPAPTAPASDKPADELETFATEQGIDPKTVERLAEIVAKRVPQADLTKEERQQLADLKTWQEGKLAEEARQAEDREVQAQAPSVKSELQIHDDAELAKVMAEIVKLAHTERFHDKEVGYIVWANRDALSKMVSPKKPSFESGAQAAPDAAPAEVEFSGKMTPAAAQKAVESTYAKGQIEIRRGS